MDHSNWFVERATNVPFELSTFSRYGLTDLIDSIMNNIKSYCYVRCNCVSAWDVDMSPFFPKIDEGDGQWLKLEVASNFRLFTTSDYVRFDIRADIPPRHISIGTFLIVARCKWGFRIYNVRVRRIRYNIGS